ncbi:cytochrome P450 [Phenylobacterium sp. LjRoot219]|uniref:cytochrome P450 n=1 Tax=Phenylobacterium sp. LjRoot219 TaxID=3342283 RepID=UPI003ECE86B2
MSTETLSPDFQIDLFAPEVVADLESVYRILRDEHPVYYDRAYDTFFFSRFEEVWEVLRIGDNILLATESNLPTPDYLRANHNKEAPPLASLNPMAPGPSLHSPWYEEMRAAHLAPLRPKSVAALRDFIRQLASERLGKLLPQRKFNLTMDYAGVVGVTVICSLFGLPPSRAEQIMQKVNELARYKPGQSVDLGAFFTALTDDIIPAIQLRRAGGADGSNQLIDGLINYRVEPEGRALSDEEICNQLVCAMVGGIESMPKVTAQGIMELWRRPEQLAAVRADLDRNLPIAVQEMIRFCAPAQYTFRTAHQDLEIAGQKIRAGQRVACLLHSASRDEREFDQPDEFVWDRPIPRVLSFGLGQHHCIGKHLATLEITLLAHEFLSRVEHFEFALEEGARNRGVMQRGWLNLPVLVLD